MEENRQHIDKLFREELGNYTELPAPDVWASLEQKLDDHYKNGPSGGSSSGGRSYSWLWFVVLVLIAALLYYGVKSFTNNRNAASGLPENTITASSQGSSSGSSSGTNYTPAGGAEEKENAAETEEALAEKTEVNEHTTADANTSAGASATNTKNANTAAAAKNNTAKQQGVETASGNGTKGIAPGANTAKQGSKSASSGAGKTNASHTTAASKTTTPVSSGSAAANHKKEATSEEVLAAADQDKAAATKQGAHKPRRNPSQKQAKSDETLASADQGSSSSAKQDTRKPGKTTSKKQGSSKTGSTAKNSNTEDDQSLNPNDQLASASSAATKPAKPKPNKEQAPATAKTASNANSEDENAATASAKKPGKPAKTKTHAANTGAEKLAGSKASSTSKNGEAADEVTKAGAANKTSGTKTKKGSGEAATKQTFAGNTGAENNSTTAPGKSANKPAKNKGTGSTAKTGAPKKTARPASDKSSISDDEGPTQTFGDNIAQNKKPKEPETKLPEDKQKIEWQKGFTADDSRGLKEVKGGNATGDAGKDDGAPKSEPSTAKGGGGGGLEDSKKWKDKKERKFNFSAGVKAGYEKGFGSFQANKWVLAPYFQYNFAEGVALVLQPSIKSASLNKTVISDATSYYNITNSRIDSNHININPPDTLLPKKIVRQYTYSQVHDSIVISSAIKTKRYYEFELPILLQYQISKTFAAYGGVTMNFSKIVEVQNDRKEFTGLSRVFNDNPLDTALVSAPAPAKRSMESLFQYEGTPYSQYTASPSGNPTSNPVRFSYTIGINYLFGNRFLFDLMFVKMFSDPAYIPDPHVKEIYKQGYLRVSLGYKFKK